jgi:hypothetical protein
MHARPPSLYRDLAQRVLAQRGKEIAVFFSVPVNEAADAANNEAT